VRRVFEKGNGHLIAGAVFSMGAAACPCPACIGSSLFFLSIGVNEKLKSMTKYECLKDLPLKSKR